MSKGKWSKRKIAGIVFAGLVCCVVLGALLLRPLYHKVMCGVNVLYPISMLIHQYSSDDSNNQYPPMSARPGYLFIDFESLNPEYISSDPQNYYCPAVSRSYKKLSLKEQFSQSTYLYLGYALSTEDELLAFLDSYPSFIESGVDFNEDLPAPKGRGSFGGDIFLRLKDNIEDGIDERYLEIPYIIEIPDYSKDGFRFRHKQDGGYMIGAYRYCQFIEYGEAFPMTPAVIEKIGELKRRYNKAN